MSVMRMKPMYRTRKILRDAAGVDEDGRQMITTGCMRKMRKIMGGMMMTLR